MRRLDVRLDLLVGVAIVGVLLAAGGGYEFGRWLLPKYNAPLDMGKVNEVYSLLKTKFDGSIDQAKLTDGAIQGMVASLGDPYTTFLTADESKSLQDELSGQLSGIGAEIGIKNNHLTVIAPVDGSPALAAGLKPGDVIAEIDGVDSSGYTLDEAVAKIRGPKGTTVKLMIIRGSDSPHELTITRDLITVKSVKWSMKQPGVGYIAISQFASDTSDLMNQAANELKAQGAKAIVLDLRSDPGGYLDAAVSVSSQFVNHGLIVEERSDNGTKTPYRATGGGKLVGLPVVVLVDGGSASAAEITAGALHDDDGALLVGETTFGKGSVQEIQPLGNESLKVTVAHWYTPKGVNISKTGIKPDIEIKNNTDDFNAGRDPQLDRALQEAANRMR